MDNNSKQQILHPKIKDFATNKTVFLWSVVSIIVPVVINIFGLKNIDILIKIIICLSITCIVLLYNVFHFYIKEREHYYVVCYLENNLILLENNIKLLETKFLKKN